MTIISTAVGKTPLDEVSNLHNQQKSLKCSTWVQSQNNKNDPGKSFNIKVIQLYAPTTKAKEPEVECFYENLQDLLEYQNKRCPFHHRGLECKVRSQETPGVTGKFGLGIQNEAGQRLTEFCQENTLVIANTLFQQQEMTLQMGITRWSVPKSD